MPGAEWLLEMFWVLSSDRQIGMAAGPVPFSAVDRWAERNGIVDPDEFDDLLRYVQIMDAAYLGQGVKPKAEPPKREMSPELFDALF